MLHEAMGIFQANLTDILVESAKLFDKAERYETLGDIYRLIVPIYEQKRDYGNLARAYYSLYEAYKNVVDAIDTGRRLLGNYFKVGFYGEVCIRAMIMKLSKN